MKAALYARVSSERQAEKDLSIPAQLKALRKHAVKHEWDVVQEFVDEAESARTAQRPAFQEMVALAKQKQPSFDVILVWKLSRFARNREDSVLYKALLRRRGIQVISINEQIDETPSGKLLEGMIEVIDEFYSTNLAQDTRRGMKENAGRGYYNGGATPYGYKAVKASENGTPKSRLAVNEAEAGLVRKVFRLCLEGQGIKEIAKTVNAEGHRTRRDKPWTNSVIHYMLSNEVYTGTTVWNKTSYSHGVRTQHHADEVLRVPDTHPDIITTVDFEKAHQLLATRSPKMQHPRRVNSRHLLSGLLHCQRCGAKMVVIPAKSGRFSYYTCQTAFKQGKNMCRAKAVNAAKLDDFMVDVIRDRILTEQHLSKLVELVIRELREMGTQATDQLGTIEKRLEDTKRRLQRLYHLIEDDEIDLSEVAPRLRDLNARREELETQRQSLLDRASDTPFPHPPKAEVRRYVADLRGTLSRGSLLERRGFMRSWIKRVNWQHPSVEIEYSLPLTPPKKTEPLDREVLSIIQNGCPAWFRTRNN